MAKADYYGIAAKYNCNQYYGKKGAQTQASLNCEAQVNAEYDRENGCLKSFGTSCGAKAESDAAAKLAADLVINKQKQITDAAIKKSNAPKVDQQKQVAPVLDINPGRKFQARAVAPGIDLASFAPQALQAPASAALKGRKLKTFSEDDSAIGNVNDMYGMKRGGRVTMASRRGDGAAIRGKTRGGVR